MFGAINGVRLREWFADRDADDLNQVAATFGVEVIQTPMLNGPETRSIMESSRVDLGVSLGNSYISPNVFSLPRHGMINVHCEVLPQFRGAQSVLWQLHEGNRETGLSIHQIDTGIDTGTLLRVERFPIEFQPTLRQTVEHNCGQIRERVPPALKWVCENYPQLSQAESPQGFGKSFTTPTLAQFLRMKRNHDRFSKMRAPAG